MTFQQETGTLWATSDRGRLLAFPRDHWALRSPEAVSAAVLDERPDIEGYAVVDPPSMASDESTEVYGGIAGYGFLADGSLLALTLGRQQDTVLSIRLDPRRLDLVVEPLADLAKGSRLAGAVALEPDAGAVHANAVAGSLARAGK